MPSMRIKLNPKIKSSVFYWLNQPAAPGGHFIMEVTFEQTWMRQSCQLAMQTVFKAVKVASVEVLRRKHGILGMIWGG